MRAINSNWPMLAVQSSFNLSATAHPIFSEDDKAAEKDPWPMLSSIGAVLDSPTEKHVLMLELSLHQDQN